MYSKSRKFKSCYEKLRRSHKLLRRKIRGKVSRSRKAAIKAAKKSINNKCIKKLKLKVPLVKRYKKSRKSRKSRRRRKRNDGADPVKDVTWARYFKTYSNDPTFDVKRVDWTGYTEGMRLQEPTRNPVERGRIGRMRWRRSKKSS